MSDSITLTLPVIRIGPEKWIVLDSLGNAFKIRAYRFDGPYGVREPSDHRSQEIIARTSVKIFPKKYDLAKLQVR